MEMFLTTVLLVGNQEEFRAPNFGSQIFGHPHDPHDMFVAIDFQYSPQVAVKCPCQSGLMVLS